MLATTRVSGAKKAKIAGMPIGEGFMTCLSDHALSLVVLCWGGLLAERAEPFVKSFLADGRNLFGVKLQGLVRFCQILERGEAIRSRVWQPDTSSWSSGLWSALRAR